MTASTGSRLSRWSQMKTKSKEKKRGRIPLVQADAIREKVDSPLSQDINLEEAAEGDVLLVEDDVEVQEEEMDLDELSEKHVLPKIEELDKDSDYTPFMNNAIPEVLKRAAMRKLWLSDPILANVDGLNDYDDDFNVIDRVIKAIDTNYRVGKGMLSQEERAAEDAEKEDAEKEEALLAENKLQDVDNQNNTDPLEADVSEKELSEAEIVGGDSEVEGGEKLESFAEIKIKEGDVFVK